MVVTDPLRLTNTAESYNIDATIDGGGVSGQANALRLGIARSLIGFTGLRSSTMPDTTSSLSRILPSARWIALANCPSRIFGP